MGRVSFNRDAVRAFDAMSRSYSKTRPHKHFVYSVEDLMTLFDVCRNTVSNWVAEGLSPSDARSPYVFNGSEIKRFHDSRRLSNKANLRIGQFKCFSCKGRVFPAAETLKEYGDARRGKSLAGVCPTCKRMVCKSVNATDFEKIWACVDTNASLASLDEELALLQGSIGNDQDAFYVKNDRIIYAWLQYAGRHDRKTKAAHVAAIRDFEAFVNGKEFGRLTVRDAANYREQLKEQAQSGSLSISTVRHRASQVKSFCNWLLKQKGFGRLDQTLPNYFELPRKFEAARLAQDNKEIPTIDEATRMVQAMPFGTMKDRRDRAMVSIAFLCALRADTITSLLIKHLETENKVTVQDGSRSRTKFGKSLRVKFFPVPPIFVQIVSDWKAELLRNGFDDNDALFPGHQILMLPAVRPNLLGVQTMRSTHAVSSAFKSASKLLNKNFSPHTAKHCIGQLSWSICKTAEQRKAWSTNMGHDDEDVTQRYYSKISTERISEIFDSFGDRGSESNEDKELMLLYHEHELAKGTTEFERARKLVEARRRRSQVAVEDALVIEDI